ncbi:hypothetical protein ALI144C_16305 [Actinosynnema sp. ALI-1.44]|uniref:hypothetical protein n=1 Tax=Actinosynnema sp. ALI-1.44 TaxID=1933779 RepID=UPI00097C55C5|nr:hypothetical protein [Actinosynnema sp. ALI-1.44]ONI84225.1 hypothetical protein ALI144C_16305 [Actinosynnema sp. ALI-1.44]
MWQQSEAEQQLKTGEDASVASPGRDSAMPPEGYEPTQVVYCTWGRERGAPPLPLASFDWSPQDGVQFTVLDHERGRSARRFMVEGAAFEQQRRMVLPSEGPVFMRALLGHGNSSSYFWFVDKTPVVPRDEGP